jgi:cytochrome P450
MELDPYAREFHIDPYPTYRWLRDHAPVYRNDQLDFYALSRHADVHAASRDHGTFSSARGTVLELMGIDYAEALVDRPMILFLDPPRQQQLRRLVSQGFTGRHLAQLSADIRTLTKDLLEPLAERGGGDLVSDFAALLPMNVIFTMLGVPEADRLQLRTWTDQSLERDPDPPYIPSHAIDAQLRAGSYYEELIADRRRHPGDDLISDLIAAEITEDGESRRLSDGEILGFVGLLGGAGNETVTKLLANALVLLHRHHDTRSRAVDDATRISDVVEETLRYWAPSQYQGRTLTKDCTLHGVTMPAGARVLLLTGAANRDERVFADPDGFDIDRPNHQQHLGFGTGVHFCLGAALARLETRTGLEEFLARFPTYTVDERGIEHVHSSNVHGFSAVPFSAS